MIRVRVHSVWAPDWCPRKLKTGVQTLCIALLLAAFLPASARAACPAAPIGSQNDLLISFLAANGTQVAPASLFSSSAEEGMLAYDDSSGRLKLCDGDDWVEVGSGAGGSATPGGADTQVQFNDGGSALGGHAGFIFDKAANDDEGLVGIGTAAALSAGATVLDITGKASTNALIMKSVTDADPPTGGSGIWSSDGTHVWLADGNVGIGTASPVLKLDVFGTSATTADGSAAPNGTIWVGANGSVSGLSIGAKGGGGNHAWLQARNTTTGLLPLALQPSGGNVGIGTTSPNRELEVAGRLFLTTNGTNLGRLILATTTSNPATNLVWNIDAAGGNLRFFHEPNLTSAGTVRIVILSSGNVGIGTGAPSHLLHVNGVARSTQASFDTSSDARVKTDIVPIDGGLETVLRLRPVTFSYTPEYQDGNAALAGMRRGFIAQEVEAVVPEMVTRGSETFGGRTIDDFRVLNNSDFVPLLVSAVKELKAENDNLRDINAAILKRLDALEAHAAQP